MACGTPFVGYATGGAVDLVRAGKNGKLVESGDIQALTSSLVDLLLNPARIMELAAGARKSIEINFDNQEIIRNLLFAYHAAVSKAEARVLEFRVPNETAEYEAFALRALVDLLERAEKRLESAEKRHSFERGSLHEILGKIVSGDRCDIFRRSAGTPDAVCRNRRRKKTRGTGQGRAVDRGEMEGDEYQDIPTEGIFWLEAGAAVNFSKHFVALSADGPQPLSGAALCLLWKGRKPEIFMTGYRSLCVGSLRIGLNGIFFFAFPITRLRRVRGLDLSSRLARSTPIETSRALFSSLRRDLWKKAFVRPEWMPGVTIEGLTSLR